MYVCFNNDGTMKLEKKLSINNKRIEKGNSLLSSLSNYVILDLETTGLSSEFDNIIEVCALKVVDDIVVDSFVSLINPEIEIEDFIIRLTGITNDMVKDAPIAEKIFPKLMKFIGNDVIIGHNVHFDINFLYDELEERNFEPLRNDLIDTMRLAKKTIDDVGNFKLQTLARKFNIEITGAHRAEADCLMTLELYKQLKELINKNGMLVKPKKKASFSIGDLNHNISDFDEDNEVFGKAFVFSGELDRFSRQEAAQIVVDLGGNVKTGVSSKIDFLVLGNLDYVKNLKEKVGTKTLRARKLKAEGYSIEIIPENVFYDML